MAAYDAARAAGEKPRLIPGEQTAGLADLPARTAALGLGGLRGALAIYLWIRVEELEPNASRIFVQARQSNGKADILLASALDKQIALRLR